MTSSASLSGDYRLCVLPGVWVQLPVRFREYALSTPASLASHAPGGPEPLAELGRVKGPG